MVWDWRMPENLIKFICGLIGVAAVAAYLILGMYVLSRLLP
jgi:hypothetical protein